MSPRGARLDLSVRRACSAALLASAVACGDGIGRPLLAIAGGAGGAGGLPPSGGGGVTAAGADATSSGGDAGTAGSSGRPFGGYGPWTGGTGARFGGDEPWLGGAARSFANPSGGEFGRMNDPLPFDGQGAEPEQVPSTAYCAEVASWPNVSAAREQSLYEAVNVLRGLGTRCGNTQGGAPVASLRMEPELRCAARVHSLDMGTRDFFAHVNPDGENPAARIAKAGRTTGITEEAIARSGGPREPSPASMILQELVFEGGGDCEALLDSRFDAIGVGYYEGLWTIDLAGP